LSLLAVRPLTDREHQIQAHLQYANMPLAIDVLDGQNQVIMLSSFKANYKLAKYAEEKPLINRLTLCAYELQIEDFTDGGPLHLVAPLEKKFKATIKMLTKYNPHGQAAFNNEENFKRLLDSQPLLLQI
jgi:23S rRNA pseudouridine955/2504/2580 synthase/23S rRNA pseudouridine1911/1915/1917 synthase